MDDDYESVAAARLVTAEAEVKMLRAERAAQKARDAWQKACAAESKVYERWSIKRRQDAKGGGDAE